MLQTGSIMKVENGRLVVPKAWEEYATRVMADILSRQLDRNVKIVKKETSADVGKTSA